MSGQRFIRCVCSYEAPLESDHGILMTRLESGDGTTREAELCRKCRRELGEFFPSDELAMPSFMEEQEPWDRIDRSETPV